MDDRSDVFDAKQAAAYMKINEQTIRRLAREGVIPAFKVGGVWRFKKSVLDSWAKEQGEIRTVPHVLVVDDEQEMLELLRRILEGEGLRVTTTQSGNKALEIIRQAAPDAVLLDLKIPDLDGASVLAEIRKEWGRMPVVILTGYPESDLVSQALKYSPITLLAKSADDGQIIEAVNTAVGKKKKA